MVKKSNRRGKEQLREECMKRNNSSFKRLLEFDVLLSTVLLFYAFWTEMKDAAGRRRLSCRSWESVTIRRSFLSSSLWGLDNWTALSESEFAAPFDHLLQFLRTLERLGDILATWVHPCWREKSARISDLDSGPQRTGFHLSS